MAISSRQAIAKIQGAGVELASQTLVDVLKPCANARGTSLVQATSYMTSGHDHLTLPDMIDHD